MYAKELENNLLLEAMQEQAAQDKLADMKEAPHGLPGVSAGLQHAYVQNLSGTLKNVWLRNVPGANRKEKKAFLRAKRKEQRKANNA